MDDSDVFAVTNQGNAELRASGTGLSPRELQILVLVDGAATISQVVKSSGVPRGEVVDVLKKLAQRKLIALADEPAALETGFFAIPPSIELLRSGKNIEPEAEQGVASLTRRGYFVRIARRAAQKRDVSKGWQPTILLIDDDPDLQKLVQTYLRLEGFTMREAKKRDEIMAAFREQPMPDLVLLDVNLPDANGFQVLARMREHPTLKPLPVILITAEATREAVLKGLNAGADGYITKPFEPDWIVTAVKEVLGLPLKDYKPI